MYVICMCTSFTSVYNTETSVDNYSAVDFANFSNPVGRFCCYVYLQTNSVMLF